MPKSFNETLAWLKRDQQLTYAMNRKMAERRRLAREARK